MKRLEIFITISLFLLFASCVKDDRCGTNIKDTESNLPPENIDYSMFVGRWYSSDSSNSYEDTFEKGGYILEIVEIDQNRIKGYTASISMLPVNRVASFDFAGKLTNNKFSFDFTDGFNNKGNGTITVLHDQVKIKINDIELSDDNASGWSYAGEAIFSVEKK